MFLDISLLLWPQGAWCTPWAVVVLRTHFTQWLRNGVLLLSSILLKCLKFHKLFPKKAFEFDFGPFGNGPCWPCFCPNRVLKEQFLWFLPLFFFFSEVGHYNIRYWYWLNFQTYSCLELMLKSCTAKKANKMS